MAASHMQPKCYLFYFNPVTSPVSTALLVLHQSLQILGKKRGKDGSFQLTSAAS